MITFAWWQFTAVIATTVFVSLRGAVLCRRGVRTWRRNRAAWLRRLNEPAPWVPAWRLDAAAIDKTPVPTSWPIQMSHVTFGVAS